MAQRNLYFTFKQGEIGKRMNFTLEDADGTFDLTNYTVTLFLKKEGDTDLAVDGAAVTKENQGTNPGECYHALDATTAAIDVATYKGELKLVAGANVLYWPVNKDNQRTYFTVEVQAPLG